MPPSGSFNDFQVFYSDVKFAPVDVSANGDNAIIPAVSGFKILPVHGLFIAANAVTIIFKSGSGSALSGSLALAPNAGFVLPETHGHFETNTGEALLLNLGSSVAVGGWIAYKLIT